MKLTKEECIKYKKELLWAYDNVGTKYDSSAIKDAISLGVVYYEKLMNEHFDNPPLKFEEIEEGMWVWIYREPAYRKILCTQTLNDILDLVAQSSTQGR